MKVDCTIKTPQFTDGEISGWHTQSGTFDFDTNIFTPHYYLNGNHLARFDSHESFEKYCVQRDSRTYDGIIKNNP